MKVSTEHREMLFRAGRYANNNFLGDPFQNEIEITEEMLEEEIKQAEIVKRAANSRFDNYIYELNKLKESFKS